jgi:hypothetical protein
MPPVEEVKQALSIAKKRELNFGLCCGKVPAHTAFCTDRNKAPKALLDIAKKEIKANKLTANNRAYGTVRCEGKLVILSLDADPKGLIARPFRKYLIQELGINGSEVKVLDRLGDDFSSAGEEGDEDTGRAEAQPDATTPETGGPDPAAIKASFDATGKQLPAALGEVRAEIAKLQAEIDRVCADLPGRGKITGAFDKLNKRLAQIERALITATQNGSKSPSASSLAQMKTLLGKADGILTGDPVMSNLDDNPFVNVKAQSGLRGLLRDIGTEMAAVG